MLTNIIAGVCVPCITQYSQHHDSAPMPKGVAIGFVLILVIMLAILFAKTKEEWNGL